MDDASDDNSLAREMPVPVENGVLSNDADNTRESEVSKFNGDTNSEELSDSDPSSDCATPATNTDSEINLKRKLRSSNVGSRSSKKLKGESDFIPPTNPYFNESLFELSGLHQSNSADENQDQDEDEPTYNNGTIDTQDVQDAEDLPVESTRPRRFTTKRKKDNNPNIQNYPQLLGLQPLLQFRCHECGMTGFSSFSLLKEHKKICTREPVVNQKPASSSKKLFVTRRNVFMCTACSVYYENYNLFLHIYKVHRRLVCLYCSAIFSHIQKFLLHLLNKHNCVPKELNTEKDFFEAHKHPCFLICCDCEKIFGDEGGEHFFGHACNGKTSLKNDSKNKLNNNKVSVNHKQVNNKNKIKSKEFIEHITGDTETSVVPNGLEAEEDSQHSTENVGGSQEPEELQPNFPLSPKPPVAIETENISFDTTETNQNDSEANLSNCENIVDVPKLNEKLDSDNENHQLNSKHELNETIASPERISDYQNIEDGTCKTEHEKEVRKVPKVTLKIPKQSSSPDEAAENIPENEDSDDSDKQTMEVDTNPSNYSIDDDTNEDKENQEPISAESVISIAGADIPVIELELEQPLDKFDIQCLLKKCLRLTIPTCVYCNHARKIAVNGKYLGLHAIAEHRFSAVVNSITAEELIPESFVLRIKESLPELQNIFFNLESQGSESLPFTRVFECFQCRYSTNAHKELYLHNRKLHAKSILLCIMCKSNFYSYSELTCHLCPGVYDQDNQISFRCSICDTDDLPSAFRLLVHLRKRHNACDVCLELCNNQSRLSNHVWKHKLHHFCYRCGIAYRNKPDITKHLFWKHGTESVLCKKCLQKKWPHVYHFCMPPTAFTCEECNLNFTRAVALKVHKRLHNNEKPHACTFENCNEKFISKKLLLKHEFKHREPIETIQKDGKQTNSEINDAKNTNGSLVSVIDENKENDSAGNEVAMDELKIKPKVDVLDLPALNLSESDSSDSEDEEKDSRNLNFDVSFTNKLINDKITKCDLNSIDSSMIAPLEPPVPILENIWDDFKNYQAQKERPCNFELLENKELLENEMEMHNIRIEDITPSISAISIAIVEEKKQLVDVIMQDHDYSLFSQVYKNEPQKELLPEFILEPLPEVIENSQNTDHDYFTPEIEEVKEQAPEQPIIPDNGIKKEIPTNPSTGSDSSSCSCGPDCSCSSGSSSSSSDSSDSDSSTSEGRRKQQVRREQRKQSTKVKKESETSHIDVVATDVNQTVMPAVELIIEETDLETTESETDEEFYDKQPQKIANKLLAEKRKELLMLAELSPLVNGSVLESSRPSTPSLPETEVAKLKPRKSKSKKKKRKSKKKERFNTDVPSTVYQYPVVSPLSISLPKNSPLSISTSSLMASPILSALTADFSPDSSSVPDSLRASKRRRVPNRFYGYSSDEEQEKLEKHQPPVLKWRKEDLPSPLPAQPPLLVPPITLKAIPSTADEEEPISVPSSFHHPHPALFKPKIHDATESNDSTSEDEQSMPTMNKPLNQPPLYCYCRCPYDEVSEMIGCDADDCLIEWFHFECVGIMVPPKGQWFCPDCRKKIQQQREFLNL